VYAKHKYMLINLPLISESELSQIMEEEDTTSLFFTCIVELQEYSFFFKTALLQVFLVKGFPMVRLLIREVALY